MYKKGYTNCENVLADFVNTICFTEDIPEHQWSLIYPTIEVADEIVESEEELEDQQKLFEAIRILKRATISTKYIPEVKWIDEPEVHVISPINITTDPLYPDLIEVTTNFKIAKDSPVEVNIKRALGNLYRNLESKESIQYAEFYVDYETSKIFIFKKSVLVRPNEKTIIEINYKTENKQTYDWYVSLFYPESYINETIETTAVEYVSLYKATTTSSIESASMQSLIRGLSVNTTDRQTFNVKFADTGTTETFAFDVGAMIKMVDPAFDSFVASMYNSDGTVSPINRERFLNTIITGLQLGFDTHITTASSITVVGQFEPDGRISIEYKNCTSFSVGGSPASSTSYGHGFLHGLLSSPALVTIPTYSTISNLEVNKAFICWQYGNEIDNYFYIKPHKNNDSPVFTCFFHQLDYKKYPIGDWLVIEYFISWDDKSVAFMLCEEPVVPNPVFGYGYFGVINSLQSVNYNDFKGNFGSFGNRSFDDFKIKAQIPMLGEIVTDVMYNIYDVNVTALFYVGNKLVDQKLLFNIINGETPFDITELIDVNDPDNLIQGLDIDYIEDFSFDNKIDTNLAAIPTTYDIYYKSNYMPSITDLKFQLSTNNTLVVQINKDHTMTTLFRDIPPSFKQFNISANGYIIKLDGGLYTNKYEPNANSIINSSISDTSIADVRFLKINTTLNLASESVLEDKYRYLVIKPINLGTTDILFNAERNDDYGSFSSNTLMLTTEIWDLDQIQLSQPNGASVIIDQDNYTNYLNDAQNSFEILLQGGDILGVSSVAPVKKFDISYTIQHYYINKPPFSETKSLSLTTDITHIPLFGVSPYEDANLEYDEDILKTVVTINSASLKATINGFTDESLLKLPYQITYNFDVKPVSQGISFADPAPYETIEQGSIEPLEEINLEINEIDEPTIRIKPIPPTYANRIDSTMKPILWSTASVSTFLDTQVVSNSVKLKFKDVGDSIITLNYKHGKMIGTTFTPDSYSTPDSNQLKCNCKTWKISDFTCDKADNSTFTINSTNWASTMNILTFTGGEILGNISDTSVQIYIEQEGTMVKNGASIAIPKSKVSDNVKIFTMDGKSSYDDFYQDIFETQKITEYNLKVTITAEKNKNSQVYKKSKTINITIKIPEKGTSSASDYLKMFATTNTSDPNYVSVAQVKQEFPEYDDYWYWIKFSGNTPQRNSVISGVDTSFYKGMNDIRQFSGEPSVSYYNDLYRTQLFKLSMDARHNGLDLPEIADYNAAMLYLSTIGITDKIKQHEIFLTYQLKVVNLIANKMSSKGYNWNNMLDKRFGSIAEWLDRSKCFVFDWFSWEAIAAQPAGGYIGGYSTAPLTGTSGSTTVLSNVVGHINMEPEASQFLPTSAGSNAEHVAFPYRWKISGYTPTTGWAAITRWDVQNGVADPLTTKYELSDLRVDSEKESAFAILDVVIHEMGHALCNYNTFINPGQPRKGYTSEWLSAGGWNTSNPTTYYAGKNDNQYWSTYGKPVTQYYTYPGPAVSSGAEPATSQYGGSHPLEDFAECYACYVLNEPYFKDMFPKKHNIIKNYLNSLNDLKLNRLP